ncbi:MAG: hypothetical protein ACTHQE_07600 [Thermomicrobiales bacterium]|jgi:hypothetical protein
MAGSREDADWYVYKTLAADGTWSIGALQGAPVSTVMVIADGMTEEQATIRAAIEDLAAPLSPQHDDWANDETPRP